MAASSRAPMTSSLRWAAVLVMTLMVTRIAGQIQVNIMTVMDSDNAAAKNGFTSAIRFLKDNPSEGAQVNKLYIHEVTKGDDIEGRINATCDLYDAAVDANEPPHIVIDATRSELESETMKSFSKALALPTLSLSYGHEGDIREWRDLSEEEIGYLVQVMPPSDIISQVVRDVVRTQNITNAGIIYDKTFFMDHKYKSLLQNLPTRHIMLAVDETMDDVKAQMRRLKTADIVHYFVLGTHSTIRKVLDAGTAEKMYGRQFSWFAITKELGDIGCACEDVKVVVIQPKTASEVEDKLISLKRNYSIKQTPIIDTVFYFDLAIRAIKAAGKLIKEGAYKDFEYIKCTAFDDQNPPSRKNFKLNTALRSVRMEDAWASIRWMGNGATYKDYVMQMEKVYMRRGKMIKRTMLGDWTAGLPGGIIFKTNMVLSDHNAITVYKIVTVVQPPFIMKTVSADGRVDWFGYCIDLIDEIKEIVNFEYEMKEAPDGKFGTMNDDEEWNGMILELIEKRADIALAPLSVMAERENFVDFTVPYYDLVGITILMKKPKVVTSLFRFLTVLEPAVWGCILVAYGFTSVLLFIFDKFSPFSYQNNKEKYIDDDEKREFTFKECLWFCMTSLTPQGGGEAPKNLSGRLVAATWWLFGFIIIASYTANLAAFLTVSRLDTPIESLTDLASQYKVQYAPTNGTSTMTYFERMEYIEKKFYEIWRDMSLDDTMSKVERAKLAVWDYPVSDKYTKMWQSMKEASLPPTFEAALERVRSSKSSSEGFAYLGDATDIRYQVLTNCDLQMVGEEFSRKPYAVAVQQGSPLKDQFNDAILKLLNQRKLETLKERWWNQNPDKVECENLDDQSDGISIENIGGVFIVIFVGIALACVTLCFEYWWYKQRRPKITDSAKILAVRQFADGKEGFPNKGTDFSTEYN